MSQSTGANNPIPVYRWGWLNHAQVPIMLLLLATALMLPYLLQPDMLMWPRSGLGTDLVTYNWPPTEYLHRSMQSTGEIPLWWSSPMGGLPMMGNPGVRVFYPPQLVLSLLPLPLATVFALVNTLNLWLAGLGGYGLARMVLKLSRGAAFVTALLVMLTPRLSSNIVGDMGYTAGLCWVPLTLLCLRLALDRLTWRWGVAAGAALAMLYLLNFVLVVYVGLLLALYSLLRLIETWQADGWRGGMRVAGQIVLMGVVAFGLAAFHLLPFLSYLPYQVREAMTLADASYLSLPVAALIHTLFPIAYKFPEWEIYAGLLPLLLAPLALKHPGRREFWLWGFVLLLAVIFSLGDATPLYALVFYAVPGFSYLRVPARMWYLAALALAMLAGMAVDYLLTGERPGGRWRRWLIGAALILTPITIVGRYITRRPNELDWLLGLLAAAGLVLAVVAILRAPRRLLIPLLALAILLDLFPLAAAFMEPIPVESVFATPEIGQHMMNAAGDDPYRVYSVRRELLDHIIVANGLEAAEGLNSFQFAPYSRFMRLASGCALEGVVAAVPPCASNEIDAEAYRDAVPDPTLLGLLNVGYVITGFPLDPQSELQLIAATDEHYLYENTAVLPRAFAVGRAEAVSSDNLWTRLSEIDPQQVALLEREQMLDFTLPDNDFYTAATHIERSPNHITIDIETPADGILVMSEVWVPGWQASINGQPASVLRVDGALRGVYLPGGKHQVRLDFMPPGLAAGLILLVLTIVGCLIAFAAAGWRTFR